MIGRPQIEMNRLFKGPPHPTSCSLMANFRETFSSRLVCSVCWWFGIYLSLKGEAISIERLKMTRVQIHGYEHLFTPQLKATCWKYPHVFISLMLISQNESGNSLHLVVPWCISIHLTRDTGGGKCHPVKLIKKMLVLVALSQMEKKKFSPLQHSS